MIRREVNSLNCVMFLMAALLHLKSSPQKASQPRATQRACPCPLAPRPSALPARSLTARLPARRARLQLFADQFLDGFSSLPQVDGGMSPRPSDAELEGEALVAARPTGPRDHAIALREKVTPARVGLQSLSRKEGWFVQLAGAAYRLGTHRSLIKSGPSCVCPF